MTLKRLKDRAPAGDFEELEIDLEDGKGAPVLITAKFAEYLLETVCAYVTLREDVRQTLIDQQKKYPNSYDYGDKFKTTKSESAGETSSAKGRQS